LNIVPPLPSGVCTQASWVVGGGFGDGVAAAAVGEALSNGDGLSTGAGVGEGVGVGDSVTGVVGTTRRRSAAESGSA
jgi:hypothetical protein